MSTERGFFWQDWIFSIAIVLSTVLVVSTIARLAADPQNEPMLNGPSQ